jgi:hypothetical protein
VNALLAYATQPGSNGYTTNWAGPPPPLGALITGDLGGQISALCALTGALAISDADPAAPSAAGAGSASAAPGATAYGCARLGTAHVPADRLTRSPQRRRVRRRLDA